jgi:bile acid:Na+ symporter, BASS family
MEISVQEMVLPIVVFFTMVSVGLDLEASQFATVFRQPRLPLLGTLIHTFAFPSIALFLIGVVVLFNLPVDDALLVGTLLIAACPSGGFSNVLVLMAGADLALSVILTTISTALSFLTIPLFFWGFAQFLPEGAVGIEVPVLTTLLQLLVLIVVPTALGGWWRQAFPGSAIRYKSKVQRLMQLTVYVVVAVILAEQWDLVSGHLLPALAWSLGLCGATLGAGYGVAAWVGLPTSACAAIALESSIRNLAVAFLVATSILERTDVAVLPTVYFVAVLVIGVLFARLWAPPERAATR